MQMKADLSNRLEIWVGIPLRFLTIAFPFLDEFLALLWWLTSIDPMTATISTIKIVALGALSILPRKIIFSSKGIIFSSVVAIAGGISLVQSAHAFDSILENHRGDVLNIGFGLVWISFIFAILFLRKNKKI